MAIVGHRILLVTPAPKGSTKGNRITAERWAAILRELRWKVDVVEAYAGQDADMLVALHARKSARSVAAFHRRHPRAPIVVVLTGTDLYRDLAHSRSARHSLELASRLVVLQPAAIESLPADQRHKARVVIQSALPPRRIPPPRTDRFEVCVIGHLRSVKDPFRAALAVRKLPVASQLAVVHIGSALTPAMETRARREMEINPRYQWLGGLPYQAAKQRLAQCRLLVLSSKMEGGANVISEAIVVGVPVVASRISGSIGLLGEDYPGYFAPGDTQALCELLLRVEQERAFLAELTRRCQRLREQFTPQRERAAWQAILSELSSRK